MGKHHFNNDAKPNFSIIVSDIKHYLEKNRAVLREIYLVGGYGNKISIAHHQTKETDISLLVAFIEKNRGDVDLLVSYIPLIDGNEISKEKFEDSLNEGVEDGSKDFSIDLWLSDRPIVCRFGPICKIFPDYVYECKIQDT